MFVIIEIPVDVPVIANLGIKCISVDGDPLSSKPHYQADKLQEVLESLLKQTDSP